jgi:hypothetical protein
MLTLHAAEVLVADRMAARRAQAPGVTPVRRPHVRVTLGRALVRAGVWLQGRSAKPALAVTRR